MAALDRRDTAEQVWLSSHGWFFLGYAAAAALAFGAAGAAAARARTSGRRRRRARCWRTAGVAAAAVPLGSYLAGLSRWPGLAHPAWWLYGLTAGWTLLAAAAALAGPWRRDPAGPFGALCAATAALLAVDVVSGSRLQQEAPFGLSLLVSGRFYGIGNDALGVYCVSVLVAAWVGVAWPPAATAAADRPAPAAAAPVVAGTVGLAAVVASGWPGFGAKVGGTIALVPCLILLVAGLAGVRVRRRLALPVALSGVALFLVFAVASYFFPAAGVSDMGAFAASLVHGHGRRPDPAQGAGGCGVAHPERLRLAGPGRRGGGRGRAGAARRAAAAAAGGRLRRPCRCCGCWPGSPGWSWCSAGSPTTRGSSCPPSRSRSRCRW